MAIDTTTDLQHTVEDAAAHLYVWALKDIPQDLRDALAAARDRETSVPGKRVLDVIHRNVGIADSEKTHLPVRRVLVGLAVLEGIAAAGSAFGSLYVFDQLAVYATIAHGIVQVVLAAWLSLRATPTARIMSDRARSMNFR